MLFVKFLNIVRSINIGWHFPLDCLPVVEILNLVFFFFFFQCPFLEQKEKRVWSLKPC